MAHPPGTDDPALIGDLRRPSGERDVLAAARATLTGGRRADPHGGAEATGDLGRGPVRLTSVALVGAVLVAMTGHEQVTSLAPTGHAAGRLRMTAQTRSHGPVELRFTGRWRRWSAARVLTEAPTLLGHLPFGAVTDPARRLAGTAVLALEPVEATITGRRHRVDLDGPRLSHWLAFDA